MRAAGWAKSRRARAGSESTARFAVPLFAFRRAENNGWGARGSLRVCWKVLRLRQHFHGRLICGENLRALCALCLRRACAARAVPAQRPPLRFGPSSAPEGQRVARDQRTRNTRTARRRAHSFKEIAQDREKSAQKSKWPLGAHCLAPTCPTLGPARPSGMSAARSPSRQCGTFTGGRGRGVASGRPGDLEGGRRAARQRAL